MKIKGSIFPVVVLALAVSWAVFICLRIGEKDIAAPDIKEAIPPSSAIEQGDRYFEELKFRDAVAAYEIALKNGPENYDVLWRLARCYSKWGVIERENRKVYTPPAIDYAERAIDADSGGFEGHLYLAESLGISLYYEGPRDQVRFIRRIKEEAERAIEIDPAHYRPYMLLGVWHRNVMEAGWLAKKLAAIFLGGLPEASMDKAVGNLKRSVRLKPDFIKTHYELALAYISLGEKDLAADALKTALRCPTLNIKEEGLRKKSIKLLSEIRK
jgi:tetratricopeptide (TPR) repeat protein